ncbi:MAG: aspartate aminotransferase family protein [Candidatus Rokubacteria bacterium]|nr:aspartate aminotransferase family protein [Candidatus Rokubacteria bacterium]
MDERLAELGPHIVTPYPGPRTRVLVERLRRVEGSGMRTAAAEYPLVAWESARGALVYDPDGNRYLDLYAGFAAATLGHAHPRVTAAIQAQAERLTHVSSAYPTPTRAALMETLLSLAPTGLTRGLFAITGGQGNDLALRLARRATGRDEFIAFRGGYFGRDAGVLGLNGKAAFRRGLRVAPGAHFFPYPYPYRCPFGNRHEDPAECGREALAYLEHALRDPASGIGEVAAIVVEPVQGNAGVVVPPPSFLPGLRRLCDELGILLILDEIQSGFGRTGCLWACEHWGVAPDLMTVGKGLGGGLAVSAVLGREGPMGALEPGQHTSTFLTNALTHAAALAGLEVMVEEKLWQRSRELGAFLLSGLAARLAGHPHVGEVRGLGLFVAVEMVTDRDTRRPAPERAREVLSRARDAGLILGLSGQFSHVVKLAPPLIIGRKQLEIALELLGEVFHA